MATPAVAGAATLARQYFVSGFYPTGAAVAGDAYTPSGVLLKAILLGGAAPMLGNRQFDGLPIGATPNSHVGFGRADLMRSLPATAHASNGLAFKRLQLVDLAALPQGSAHTYVLRGKNSAQAIVVTLTWYDYPAALSASQTLVNDLDLAVVVGGSTTYHPNRRTSKDWVNTVERITLPTVAAETDIVVTVYAAKVYSAASSTQRYALTVHGDYHGKLVHDANPEYAKIKDLSVWFRFTLSGVASKASFDEDAFCTELLAETTNAASCFVSTIEVVGSRRRSRALLDAADVVAELEEEERDAELALGGGDGGAIANGRSLQSGVTLDVVAVLTAGSSGAVAPLEAEFVDTATWVTKLSVSATTAAACELRL